MVFTPNKDIYISILLLIQKIIYPKSIKGLYYYFINQNFKISNNKNITKLILMSNFDNYYMN